MLKQQSNSANFDTDFTLLTLMWPWIPVGSDLQQRDSNPNQEVTDLLVGDGNC